jgi:hypothetical protein
MHYVFVSSLSGLVYSCKIRGTGRGNLFFTFHSRVYGIMCVCMSVASLLHSFTTPKGQVSGQRYTSNTSKQTQNNLWALSPTIIRRHSQAGHQYRFALWLLNAIDAWPECLSFAYGGVARRTGRLAFSSTIVVLSCLYRYHQDV